MISDLTMKCDRNIFDAKGYLAQEIPIPPLFDRKKFDFPVVKYHIWLDEGKVQGLFLRRLVFK